MALHEDHALRPAGARPWHDLPAGLSALLSDAIPSIAGEVLDVVARAIPEYRVPDERVARDVRRGVEGVLEDFAAVLAPRRSRSTASHALYVGLGQQEWRSGRTLDALHAAYHLGARVVWRRISTLATAAGADPATVSLLADSVFAYLDEVAAVSADGFAAASAAAAGHAERQRQRLLAALLGSQPDGATLELLARGASWPLPRTVAAVAVTEPEDHLTARRLPADVLVGVADGVGCLLVPDPGGPGRPGQLAYALATTPGSAILGPTVALADAPRSWARARAVWQLAADARIDAAGLQHADDHLVTLLLAGEAELVDDLARARLAPLALEPPRSRERLEATLLAYLRHRGNGPQMAAELHVHPQTVRYRLTRLRDLLGAALDDPDTRFELEVVLRARARAAPSSDQR